MTITYVLGQNIYINLTNRCPNACDFCIRSHGSSIGDGENLWLDHEPDRQEIWEDIQKRDLNQYKELVICGYGEPTCRLDDMLWLCGEIRRMSGIVIRLNTNGLSDLINGKSTAPLLDGLIDILSVSLNASTPEKYDALCHSQYGLEALPAILKFTTTAGFYVPRVFMTVVDHKTPPAEISACRELCAHTGAELHVRRFITSYAKDGSGIAE